jgi:putative ABC transport system ATP-binding protein
MPSVVKIEDIHKIYDSGEVPVHAVRGVTLDIQQNEFVALMGASGSGKSTLMNVLGCLDRATRGRYLLDGVDVSGLDKNELADIRNQKLGFVFQGFNLLARTTALENVELPCLYGKKHLSSRKMRERAMHCLEIVGLSNRADHMPNQLSGGQQQRVAIARALVNNPSIVLADEPTGNLDSRTSVEVMGIFQQLNEKGITVILVTHEPDIASFSKRNIAFRDGRISSDRRVSAPRAASEVIKEMPLIDDEEVAA